MIFDGVPPVGPVLNRFRPGRGKNHRACSGPVYDRAVSATWEREVLVFGAGERELVLPAECASCGAPPARARLERGPLLRELFVPYCAACDARLSRHGTLVLAASIASGLCAVALGLLGPLLWPWAGGALLLVLSVLSGSLPLVLAYLLEPAGFWLGIPAVWWRQNARLVCERVGFARELERLNGVSASVERVWPLGHWGWAIGGIMLGALCSALAFSWHHPRLHVLNLSQQRLSLWVDGRELGELGPTGFEGAGAGLIVRVPAGPRVLEVRGPTGVRVAEVSVQLERGVEHLYAPASSGHCFWLELTGYGRQSSHRVVPLAAADRFWALRAGVDTWFVAPPPPSSLDRRSSGGLLRSVRHARCEDAPTPL
jgi:hypothetical protein